MAQNTTISAIAGAWTQLTSADVTAITFQNIGNYSALVQATVGATEPTSIVGSVRYSQGQGERAVALADLFPGVVGANRLWAYVDDNINIFVSHA